MTTLLQRISHADLGESTHTLVPCWMPKPLPPRNQCTCCFAPTLTCISVCNNVNFESWLFFHTSKLRHMYIIPT